MMKAFDKYLDKIEPFAWKGIKRHFLFILVSVRAQFEGETQAEETPEHSQESAHPQRECPTYCQTPST